jgi:FXSXX-COOH protein
MPETELSDPSRVCDSRDVSLAELSAMSDADSDQTLGRLLPKSEQATPVPVASFQSAI